VLGRKHTEQWSAFLGARFFLACHELEMPFVRGAKWPSGPLSGGAVGGTRKPCWWLTQPQCARCWLSSWRYQRITVQHGVVNQLADRAVSGEGFLLRPVPIPSSQVGTCSHRRKLLEKRRLGGICLKYGDHQQPRALMLEVVLPDGQYHPAGRFVWRECRVLDCVVCFHRPKRGTLALPRPSNLTAAAPPQTVEVLLPISVLMEAAR